MYLSKLEILGFKSFAQKTVVHFLGGMTGIVGPNGCGKTNIVDAIRWCLGEQKSSTLRSDKMENVIFNGTASKKPLGMSEVSLTIQNDKGILPSEYTEVVITRRIFRSGESEYLMNKNLCRLKDITNLFMDTGMGANAYSVIELKMVEAILSNRTDERRVMFEEAAGVNKYKLRRRHTLKKLDDVKLDLNRVNDIVTEVEKKVNSLERQAKRAEKYNKVSVTLRELEMDLSEREYAQYHKTKLAEKEQRESLFNRRLKIESDIAKLEDQVQAVKQELYAVEGKLQEKRAAVTRQTESIHKVDQAIVVAEERKKSLAENVVRFETDITELNEQLAAASRQILEYQEQIQTLELELKQKNEAMNSLARQADEKQKVVDDKRAVVKQQNESVIAVHKEFAAKENELLNDESALARLRITIDELNQFIQTHTITVSKTVSYIEELSQEKTETENRLSEAEEAYQQQNSEKSHLESELNQLRSEEFEARRIIAGINDKIAFLQNVIDSLEGFSKGAKALLENAAWHSGQKTLFAHIGSTEEKYRFAIEAAIRNNLNSIILDTLQDIKNGIAYLAQNDFGKASFYLTDYDRQPPNGLLNTLNSFVSRRMRKKIARSSGFIGWCDELIQVEEHWKGFFNSLLSRIAIVNDLETAFSLAGKFKGFSFATLNGDLIDGNGLIEGGAAPKIDETLFGRRQFLEQLKKDLPAEQAKYKAITQSIALLESSLGAIDMKALSDRTRILINDLANIEKQLHQFEFEKNKALDEIEKSRTQLSERINQSIGIEERIAKLTSDVASFKNTVQQTEDEALRSDQDFRGAESEFNQIISDLNALNLESERVSGEKKNLENAIKRNEEYIAATENAIQRREQEKSSAQKESEGIALVIDEETEELYRQQNELKVIKDSEKVISDDYNRIRDGIQTAEKEISGLRKQRDILSDDLHHCELKLSELEMKIKNLKDHIAENYSLQLELKEFDDLESFDFLARAFEVSALKQQIKNLGPVNLLSFSEYDEEKQRFEFLSKQRDDLIASEKDLIKTIEEINHTAQNLFLETFEKIRTNFTSIFRNLFNPGDEADLRLEESADPLEAKIEIIAKPKGKRPTSIELLSGGEKTLTAIALLFAIYLVKPSPFCILDEIDAPLDDANIDRFTKIIKDFSENTQFIVVTHNKRTMESADALYGVTMQEEGISKLVSVRFNEDMNIVA